jgi:hypothetical protein
MLILVKDAAEAIASSYVEAGYLVRVGDLCRQRVQRACVGDALVGAVSVVELFELVQGVEQVPLVPDQAAVQQFAAAGLRDDRPEQVADRKSLGSARPGSDRPTL